jgi:CRISPR-associated protein Cas2
MMVLILTACPPALRGDLTKWFQEISTGVYVGKESARVRDEIWKRVCENTSSGKATMVFSTNNEQKMDFRVHNTSWEPIDFDGLKLILRPSSSRLKTSEALGKGFSNASKNRKAKQILRQKQMKKKLPETYVVIDVETTGLSVIDDDIIEIGAISVCNSKIKASFNALIKISIKLPLTIRELTGLTEDILNSDGKELIDVMQDFLEFVGDLPVVSHNSSFDYGFLRHACESCNLPPFANQCVDTLTVARRLVDDVNNYKLETLLNFFEIETDVKHRSIEDCISTKRLYEKLIELRELKE